jgi:putative transposase
MLTPRRFQKDLRFFHLNTGLSDRTWQTIPQPARWHIFCRALQDLQHREDFTAHAFVLMGTHFHLLFSTHAPREHILAEELHRLLSDQCNQTWDALDIPLFCDPVQSAEYYKNAYKYVYRNPVEAGLCRRPEDYEFSTLRDVLGKSGRHPPVIDNMGLIHSPGRMLAWLNDETAAMEPRFFGGL